jgi:hypothetical protein
MSGDQEHLDFAPASAATQTEGARPASPSETTAPSGNELKVAGIERAAKTRHAALEKAKMVAQHLGMERDITIEDVLEVMIALGWDAECLGTSGSKVFTPHSDWIWVDTVKAKMPVKHARAIGRYRLRGRR